MSASHLAGSLFDGWSATPRGVTVSINERTGELTVLFETGEKIEVSRCDYSFEIFNDTSLIPLKIPTIGRIELPNTPETRGLLRPHLSFSGKIPAWMERHGHRAIISMVVALVSITLFVIYAPPFVVPIFRPLVTERIQSIIANQSMAVLDRIVFEASTIDENKRREVTDEITKLQERFFPGRPMALHFRQIRERPTVMNAAALIPNDMIIIDATVKGLSRDELRAVILHEVGHLKHNHGVDALVQSSFLGLVSLMIFGGDPGTLHGIAVSLLHAQYSQSHEMDADRFAAESLNAMGLNPMLLADALDKIERAAEYSSSGDKKEMSDYFASHPRTSERKAALQAFTKHVNR
jgi:Zn-dependent protease with chaperone function